MGKRQKRILKHEQLAQRDEQFVKRDYLITELEFFSETSDVNISIDSYCFFDVTQPVPRNDKQQLAKGFVKDIPMTAVSKNISSRDLMHVQV